MIGGIERAVLVDEASWEMLHSGMIVVKEAMRRRGECPGDSVWKGRIATRQMAEEVPVIPGREETGPRSALAGMADVVLDRCDQIALFSEDEGKITRTFLSEPMRRLHGKLTEWMEEAGLAVRTDPAGNLIGRYDGLRPESPVLAIGSHLDTVPGCRQVRRTARRTARRRGRAGPRRAAVALSGST